jgi:hypothetical protein
LEALVVQGRAKYLSLSLSLSFSLKQAERIMSAGEVGKGEGAQAPEQTLRKAITGKSQVVLVKVWERQHGGAQECQGS